MSTAPALAAILFASCAMAWLPASAQAQPAAPAPRPPSDYSKPEAVRHMNAASAAGGEQWRRAVDYFCKPGNSPNAAHDPLIWPRPLFDNVHILGRTSTVVYAVRTSAGIVLIDAGDSVTEDQLEAQMKTAGLSPADIKYVFIAHGHGDHYGGARALQQKYGARIAVSMADWQTMAEAERRTPGSTPKQDVVLEEGKPVTVGDFTITPVLIPGHTPGSMAFIFPVKDGGRTYNAGLFGGTILLHDRISNDNLALYVRSIERYRAVAERMNVEVEVQNHPLFDDMWQKQFKLETRKPGDPHPFVVGQAGYGRFLTVMSECAQAHRAARP